MLEGLIPVAPDRHTKGSSRCVVVVVVSRYLRARIEGHHALVELGPVRGASPREPVFLIPDQTRNALLLGEILRDVAKLFLLVVVACEGVCVAPGPAHVTAAIPMAHDLAQHGRQHPATHYFPIHVLLSNLTLSRIRSPDLPVLHTSR